MRSTGSGPMGALLMLAPLVAVPILAVVGIPQFAPGNLIDPNGPKSTVSVRDSRALAEPRFGDAARHDADDLFAPLDESAGDVAGFDDPLASRKPSSRGRNSRRGADEEFEEEPPRSRGSRRSPLDDDQDNGFAEPRAEGLADSEEPESDPPVRNRQRPNSKHKHDEFEELANNARPFEEEENETAPRTQPRGERLADASFGDSRSGTKSRLNSLREQEPEAVDTASDDSEANLFEAPPVRNTPRPSEKKKAPPAPPRSRDPRDAPLFQPGQHEPEEVVDAGDSFAPPPAAKVPNSGRRGSQVVPPPAPPEVIEEPAAAPEVSEEEQFAGVDELTWKAGAERLRELGVGQGKQYFTYLEDRNLFLFTCSAVHRKNPKKTERFEAEAEEPLLAVRQVLEQLEAWQAPTTQRRAAGRDQE